MEENINSIFGLDNSPEKSNINGVPFYLSMPNETQSTETSEEPIIQTPEESNPQTISQSSVTAVSSPPPLLAKPDEENTLTPPPLLAKPEVEQTKTQPSVNAQSMNFMQQAFKESEVDDNVVGQKVKSSFINVRDCKPAIC
jgi:hypothetical protein